MSWKITKGHWWSGRYGWRDFMWHCYEHALDHHTYLQFRLMGWQSQSIRISRRPNPAFKPDFWVKGTLTGWLQRLRNYA